MIKVNSIMEFKHTILKEHPLVMGTLDYLTLFCFVSYFVFFCGHPELFSGSGCFFFCFYLVDSILFLY